MSQDRSQPTPLVLRKDDQGISVVTINRPAAYNALSIECMEALITEFTALSKDQAVRVIILEGSGKGFCAGHDLKQIKENREPSFYKRTFETCSRLMLAITHCPKPVIAKVHGIATAAGCQLVASCDLAVATVDTRFATPGVNIGLFCSTPMVALSRNVSRKHAMEMLLLGEMISAQKAYEIGLINRVVTADKLDRETLEIATKIASKSSLTIKTGKRAFYDQIDKDLEGAYEHCGNVMVENLMTRDAMEGISAFIEKRTPTWCGQ